MEKNESDIGDIKKYPKSKNKFQCLGPCYQPSTIIVHPTLLEIVTNNENPFCPVNEWTYEDPTTGRKQNKMTDICINPTENTNISNKDLELNILTPLVDFNAEQFLKIYYNIFSFEDGLDWCDTNKHAPIDTQLRIVKGILKVFGKNIDIIDSRFIDFLINLIKKKYISDIYIDLHKYIGVSMGTKDNANEKFIMLVNKDDNELNQNDYYLERINFFVKVFITKDDIYKFVMRYFKQRKDNWDNINDHVSNMLTDLTDYLTNKINLTLKNK